MTTPAFYPIFLREMLLFKRKLIRIGYLFSAMVVPLIYLITFGVTVQQAEFTRDGVDNASR